MLRTTSHQLGQLRRLDTRIPTICVVDPQADDYQGWEALAEAKGAKLQIVANANEALRNSRSKAVDLWVINTVLVDLSGYELCSMLRAQQPHALVCLLADEYSPEAEQAAWRSRASMFAAKPSHRDWLKQWLACREQHQKVRCG